MVYSEHPRSSYSLLFKKKFCTTYKRWTLVNGRLGIHICVHIHMYKSPFNELYVYIFKWLDHHAIWLAFNGFKNALISYKNKIHNVLRPPKFNETKNKNASYMETEFYWPKNCCAFNSNNKMSVFNKAVLFGFLMVKIPKITDENSKIELFEKKETVLKIHDYNRKLCLITNTNFDSLWRKKHLKLLIVSSDMSITCRLQLLNCSKCRMNVCIVVLVNFCWKSILSPSWFSSETKIVISVV